MVGARDQWSWDHEDGIRGPTTCHLSWNRRLEDQQVKGRGAEGALVQGSGGCGHGVGSRTVVASCVQVCVGGTLTLWPPPGLVELLNRVQSSGAHDQRGVLRKEDLVLPEFLQLPAQGPNSPKAPPQTEASAPPQRGPLDSTAHSAL